MNVLPTRFLVAMAIFVTFTVMKYAIMLGGGAGFRGGNRADDIERFHLQGSEIASYDACRAALGSTQGVVPSGQYCGCLVVGGATNMHGVTQQSLQPVVVANYKGSPPPSSVKDEMTLRVVNTIEVAGSTCRHVHRDRASYDGDGLSAAESALRNWRETQRQLIESPNGASCRSYRAKMSG